MKSILALSGIALVIFATTAQADPVRPLDPHEQARQLILTVTQHSPTISSTMATATLAPTDPHELARQRILASPVPGIAVRSALATESQSAIDPHERARHAILGGLGESETSSTLSSHR